MSKVIPHMLENFQFRGLVITRLLFWSIFLHEFLYCKNVFSWDVCQKFILSPSANDT